LRDDTAVSCAKTAELIDLSLGCGVAWSVSLSVTVVNCAKTAEPIEMQFRVRTLVRPGTMYYIRVQIPNGKG